MNNIQLLYIWLLLILCCTSDIDKWIALWIKLILIYKKYHISIYKYKFFQNLIKNIFILLVMNYMKLLKYHLIFKQ